MQYLAYISFAFVGIQLVNVLINALFRQTIFKTAFPTSEPISVLIPARNEENNIGHLLAALKNIPGDAIEILVCNDHSTDRTEEIVKTCAANDRRVRLIESDELPKGWLGKPHACYQLARQAKGRYFLFVDADVRLFENIVADAVFYAQKHKLTLLSVFPRQVQLSFGEKCSIPLMNYILLTMLPLIFVKVSPFTSHSAANGQFMLFEAGTYKRFQPHEQFKKSAVEDIAIARFYKSKKNKTACLTGERRVQCRMYTSYNDALNGFSKNIFMFFGNVPVLAFLFWACASFGLVATAWYDLHWALAYLLIVIAIQVGYACTCQQPVIRTIFLFPVHLFFMVQVLIKASVVGKKKNYLWKGRNIYS